MDAVGAGDRLSPKLVKVKTRFALLQQPPLERKYFNVTFLSFQELQLPIVKCH